MNVTETAYANLLQARKEAGEIIAWEFEPIKLKLADKCFYTPDFLVMFPDGSLLLVDVKGTGPIDDKSVVKIKTAAEKFWMFDFCFEVKQTKKNGGGWLRKDFA